MIYHKKRTSKNNVTFLSFFFLKAKKKKMKSSNLKRFIQLLIVVLSCVLAFLIRQFANVINEPIIHEFDPHFNWRCTKYIDEHGLYEFLGWFDNISWYPQGRPVGETSYPGLMYTTAIVKWTLQKLHIFVPLRDICVYTGPVVSVLSVLIAFLFGQLIYNSQAGTACAVLTSFIPGMIPRSVGGSYDYECIALFIIVLSVYTFTLALRKGSIILSVLSALSYAYLGLTWGGYVFVSNCIPLFVAGLVALGRYSWRLHITYSVWAVLGTLLLSQIPFISDKILKKPEHFAILAVFFVLQLWGFVTFIKSKFSQATFNTIMISLLMTLPLVVLIILTIGISTGLLGGFTGRLLQMFDPTYASKHIPIIASVAEHQPSSWSKYFMDCSFYLVLFPLGGYQMIKIIYKTEKSGNIEEKNKAETMLLVLILGFSLFYFASNMVRLVIIFTPALAIVSGLALHFILHKLIKKKAYTSLVGLVTLITLFVICVISVLHSVLFACYSYSGDHMHFTVITPRGQESSDDYREGYRWLWDNTQQDAIVMSWWDYGYQITSMGNRGCIADGNTNNFTHIGIIGMTMSSPEEVSWRLARMLNVQYMLVIFGGASHYSGDDINKFLWMPRIANQTFTNISDTLYQITPYHPVVGERMTTNMTHSMMFKFCYKDFSNYRINPHFQYGYDTMRQAQVNEAKRINLKLFEEAYTTKNWIVRIYKVLPDPIFDRVY